MVSALSQKTNKQTKKPGTYTGVFSPFILTPWTDVDNHFTTHWHLNLSLPFDEKIQRAR